MANPHLLPLCIKGLFNKGLLCSSGFSLLLFQLHLLLGVAVDGVDLLFQLGGQPLLLLHRTLGLLHLQTAIAGNNTKERPGHAIWNAVCYRIHLTSSP